MNYENEFFFKETFEQMHEGIQIVDREYRYVFVNEAVAKQGLRSRSELLNQKMSEIYPGIEQTDFFNVLKSVMTDRISGQMENHFVFPDGSACWFDLFIEPHPVGVLIRSFDITKRKIIEEQYQNSQKLEAIGLLAGGIAHDFNNKLGVMTLFCEMALGQVTEQQGKLKNHLLNILSAVESSGALTKKLLAYGRKQVLDVRVINLNDLLSQTGESLSRLLGERISIHYHLASDLGNVRTDWAQMDQVILNLSINARDAMESGGNLTFETANVELDAAYCRMHPAVIPGRYVMLALSDDGSGMEPEIRKRIFEPFFTTKAVGKGTGLGLASVYGAVNQCRGHIWLYSEPGVGTTFKIYFPMVEEAKDSSRSQVDQQHPVKGNETLMLVEDDPLLRQAFTETLEQAGYTVVVAANAEEAELLFVHSEKSISLLVTDVILPQKSGRELANSLKTKNPDLKVLFVSGYTENSIVHNRVLDEGFILLEKPVSTGKLLNTIRQVIEGKLQKGVF